MSVPVTIDETDKRGAYIPYRFLSQFLDFLNAHSEQIEVITYDDLPWSGDCGYKDFYPKEYEAWKLQIKNKQRDREKSYLVIQFDVDGSAHRTMRLIEEMGRKDIPANVMIFNRRVNRKHMQETGELSYTEYPLDIPLMLELQDSKRFVIAYHANVLERAGFDKQVAQKIYEQDVTELQKTFRICYSSAHGGPRSPEGESNYAVDLPASLENSVRWVANKYGVRFDGHYSDGGINNPKRDPNERDLRNFVRSFEPGKRYRILLHPQYYGFGRGLSPNLKRAKWYTDLLAGSGQNGSLWDDVNLT